MRHLKSVRPVASILLIVFALAPGIIFAAPGMADCKRIPVLDLDRTSLIEGADAAAAKLFALEIPVPGFLAIELNVPGIEESKTWIDLAADACAPQDGRIVRAVERSLNRQIWEIITPGLYHLRVGTVAPQRTPPRFKITTRLISGRSPDAPAIAKDGGVGECDGEILPCKRSAWCAGGEPADDQALCARSIRPGQTVAGELGNVWADDHDYFEFTLERTRVVRLETSGPVDTFGVLSDGSGERLAAADGGGAGENFALVAELRPGRYHVRVEGMVGAEGRYRLRLSEVR